MECKGCGKVFVQRVHNHIFCGLSCQQASYKISGRRKEVVNKYATSEQGKEALKNYYLSEEGKKVRKQYLSTENGKAHRKKHMGVYNKKNRDKFLARLEAYRNLPDSCCEVDGCDVLGERHHEDYSKPLEVMYLCRRHHSELHKELNKV